jgi:NADH-quinone oxidoreductase subunit M
VFMVIAAVGTVLAAGYLLWLFQRVAFGEPKDEFADGGHGSSGAHGGHGVVTSVGAAANDIQDGHSDIHDVKITEWIAWTPFLIGIVVFGVYPNLLFKIIDPASQVVLKAFGKG